MFTMCLKFQLTKKSARFRVAFDWISHRNLGNLL
jgi:hypothetical protein